MSWERGWWGEWGWEVEVVRDAVVVVVAVVVVDDDGDGDDDDGDACGGREFLIKLIL